MCILINSRFFSVLYFYLYHLYSEFFCLVYLKCCLFFSEELSWFSCNLIIKSLCVIKFWLSEIFNTPFLGKSLCVSLFLSSKCMVLKSKHGSIYLYLLKQVRVVIYIIKFFSSGQFTQLCLTQPYGLYHTRLPCPAPTHAELGQTHVHRVSNAISSSVITFSSCLQSFPASGSFPKSQLFTSGGQSTEASASASVFPVNILRLSGLISLQYKGLSRVFSSL